MLRLQGYAYRISLTGWTASGAPESSEAAGSAVATFSTFRVGVVVEQTYTDMVLGWGGMKTLLQIGHLRVEPVL